MTILFAVVGIFWSPHFIYSIWTGTVMVGTQSAYDIWRLSLCQMVRSKCSNQIWYFKNEEDSVTIQEGRQEDAYAYPCMFLINVWCRVLPETLPARRPSRHSINTAIRTVSPQNPFFITHPVLWIILLATEYRLTHILWPFTQTLKALSNCSSHL